MKCYVFYNFKIVVFEFVNFFLLVLILYERIEGYFVYFMEVVCCYNMVIECYVGVDLFSVELYIEISSLLMGE